FERMHMNGVGVLFRGKRNLSEDNNALAGFKDAHRHNCFIYIAQKIRSTFRGFEHKGSYTPPKRKSALDLHIGYKSDNRLLWPVSTHHARSGARVTKHHDGSRF